MMTLRHILELMINPIFILFLILSLSIIFLWCRLYPLFTKAALSCGLILLLLVSTGWLPQSLITHFESQFPVVTQIDPQIKWIVVLSGGQRVKKGMPVNDLLSSASMDRLIEGLRLFRALPTAQLVISGGGTIVDQKEAILLAQVADWFSIPKAQIMLENNSVNTADQAKALASIVHDAPFYLVTSALHMPRAMVLCQQQGLHPIAAPTDFAFLGNNHSWTKMMIPNMDNVYYFTAAMHEMGGRVIAYFQSHISQKIT